jgi:hypothetical protein
MSASSARGMTTLMRESPRLGELARPAYAPLRPSFKRIQSLAQCTLSLLFSVGVVRPLENVYEQSEPMGIKRLAAITGYSEDAVHHKVKNGTWVQGRVFGARRRTVAFS